MGRFYPPNVMQNYRVEIDGITNNQNQNLQDLADYANKLFKKANPRSNFDFQRDLLQYLCVQIKIPEVSFESTSIPQFAYKEKVYQMKILSTHELELEYIDFIYHPVAKMFLKYILTKIYNQYENTFYDQYKTAITVYYFSKPNVIIKTMKFFNQFPFQVNFGSLQYDSPRQTITVSFKYSHYIET